MIPVIEFLKGPVNGSNRLFETSCPYLGGSVRLFLNGQLNTKDLKDGWVELGESKIRLETAPRVGDVIQAYYLKVL